jgi:hypothetical protein
MITPLTSVDCDLRDFPFMPLDVVRLRDSDLAAMESPEACWAAVLLWCASWHQLPAASLPNDDRVLANLAGFGRVVKEWQKVREGALRGWIECSDGRLYHPVIADKANTAWEAKLQQAWRTELSRIKKHNQRHTQDIIPEPSFKEFVSSRTKAICPQDNNNLSQGQKEIVPNVSHGQGEGVPDVSLEKQAPIERDMDRDRDIENKDTRDIVETGKSGAKTFAGLVCGKIVSLFKQNDKAPFDVNQSNPEFLACIDAGATEDEFMDAARIAIEKGQGFKYLVGIVIKQRERAKNLDLHKGPLKNPHQKKAEEREAYNAENNAKLAAKYGVGSESEVHDAT